MVVLEPVKVMHTSHIGDMPKEQGPEDFLFSWGCRGPLGPSSHAFKMVWGVSETRPAPFPHSILPLSPLS